MADLKVKNNKKINIRKYINCALLMVAIILVAVIATRGYNAYKEYKLGESVFIKMGGNLQYKDIDSATIELPTDGFILISYTKNEEVKGLESDLKKAIVNNELQSNFYYLDVTDMMLEEGFIDSLNEKFKLEDRHMIDSVPALLYYRDGKFMTSLSSTKEKMLNVDDFNKLLDSYEVLERN
ncbi:MAG: hypothetical protein HFG33_01700 [Bacilli bacterium]|nr:hypothetical protein [Bacilli bacterium]